VDFTDFNFHRICVEIDQIAFHFMAGDCFAKFAMTVKGLTATDGLLNTTIAAGSFWGGSGLFNIFQITKAWNLAIKGQISDNYVILKFYPATPGGTLITINLQPETRLMA